MAMLVGMEFAWLEWFDIEFLTFRAEAALATTPFSLTGGTRTVERAQVLSVRAS